MTEESNNSESTGGDTVAEALGDAVESLEDATVDTFKAACEAGDPEQAERVAAAVIENLRRATAHVEEAAEIVEEAAEEVAEEAVTEEAVEAAESAVEAAHDAQEDAEQAEAVIREEVREAGGAEAVEVEAVAETLTAEAEGVAEVAPVEAAPSLEAEAEFEAEIATAAVETRPAVIAPEKDHPYFRKRKLFGKFTI